jgi:nitrite reductase (NADH) large subunit
MHRPLMRTGSVRSHPAAAGQGPEGVITATLRTTNAMIDAAQKYQHAVVIGGGLLGLEAASPMLRGT